MAVQRQSYDIGHTPKCLVVVDDSAECDRAIRYAGRWAARAGGGIVMLHVIETEDQNQQWLGVADLMRAEAQDEANAALDQAATLLSSIGIQAPDRVIREGDPTTQILATVEADRDIALLVLAANAGAEGPGPLVSHVTKTIGAFPVPLVIVPGDLADADIDALSQGQVRNRDAPLLIVRGRAPSAMRTHQAGLEPALPEKIMFIQTEATPNPATLKFIPGRVVLPSGTMEFSSREAAARSPLAERLFAIGGVTGVFYGADFITVTKNDGEWQHLKPAILGAIMEHYMSGAPLLADGSAANDDATDEDDEFYDEADTETVGMIKDLIESRVRPAVANDGGDITFRGFKDGIVYLNMKGACSGCPSSTATLQHGIQNLLKHFVPEVVEVRPM